MNISVPFFFHTTTPSFKDRFFSKGAYTTLSFSTIFTYLAFLETLIALDMIYQTNFTLTSHEYKRVCCQKITCLLVFHFSKSMIITLLRACYTYLFYLFLLKMSDMKVRSPGPEGKL